jgi:hypothetical protein
MALEAEDLLWNIPAADSFDGNNDIMMWLDQQSDCKHLSSSSSYRVDIVDSRKLKCVFQNSYIKM